MAVDMETLGQISLFEYSCWRTTVRIEPDHKLAILCRSLPWEEMMEQVIPILYDEQGISEVKGRPLNLRAHLGAYILQSVHGWTDRWCEEMLKFYIPARLFCGFLESEGSLDHTSIEGFRNRLGAKGAQLITGDVMKAAKEFGFTVADDVDMDTTVQSAGITHPTEMKLMDRLMKKVRKIHEQLKKGGRGGIKGIKRLAQRFKTVAADYRFFAKTKQTKSKAIKAAQALSAQALVALSAIMPEGKAYEGLLPRYQQDLLKLLALGPRLLEQISYWISTGKVAKDKIISLWKMVPAAIKKGKLGKPVEFGRKWIINCYRGGYVLISAPENPKISDQHSVMESLSLHSTVFDTMPSSYGTDRGMCSIGNLELCLSAGIDKIAIQPKGQAPALVGQRELCRFTSRRAGIEPRIAHLKTRGLGTSRMKSDLGDLISGYRAALSWNLSLFMRNLALQPKPITPHR